jgi:hypothetical protein
MPTGVVQLVSNSGKVGVVWRSPVIKNASLPESGFVARRSQADGTARTGQADTQAHHSLRGTDGLRANRSTHAGNVATVGVGSPDPKRVETSAFTPRRMS